MCKSYLLEGCNAKLLFCEKYMQYINSVKYFD